MMNCPGNYPINYPINHGQSPLPNYRGCYKVRTQHVTQYKRGRCPPPELEGEEDGLVSWWCRLLLRKFGGSSDRGGFCVMLGP